jgi:hypothetical protein
VREEQTIAFVEIRHRGIHVDDGFGDLEIDKRAKE